VTLWETLLRPDKEERENSDRRVVGDAANILQVGEFQLLQLAYRDWHGDDMPVQMVDRLFDNYMINGVVPPWGRHYAREILRQDSLGRLDGQQRGYHRYDCEYRGRTPLDARGICFALGLAAFMVVGGIAISNFEADVSTSMFPPYLSDTELDSRSGS
jgi:hypothetical protein